MAANSSDILSHPEILPAEKLRDILLSRGLPSKDLVDKEKNDLVQLFYRFIVPLPQRTSHMARRANRLQTKMTVVDTRRACANEEGCISRGIKRYVVYNADKCRASFLLIAKAKFANSQAPTQAQRRAATTASACAFKHCDLAFALYNSFSL